MHPPRARTRPEREGTVRLDDGRNLRWAQWGHMGGTPVMMFHGNPSSRLDHVDHEVLAEADVGLTTVDRPGLGGSAPRPGRRFADWPDDVLKLANALGLERFHVYAVSMGGPHALACGARLPDRVMAIAVEGSPGPWDEPGFEHLAPPPIAAVRERFARDVRAAMTAYRAELEEQRNAILAEPEATLEAVVSRLEEPDRRWVADPANRAHAAADAKEALRPGVEGFFEERMAGYVFPWGFRLEEVAVPVSLYYGAEDVWIPPEIGRQLARRLPRATCHVIEGIGHFLPTACKRDILLDLVAGDR